MCLHHYLIEAFITIILPELGLLWIYSFMFMLIAIFASYMVFLESEMYRCMWFALPDCLCLFF